MIFPMSRSQFLAVDQDFYKDLLENLYDGIYFVDSDRRITYWNKAAEQITGYSARQVVGKHCRDNVLNHVLANGVELCTNHCPLVATMQDGKRREAEVFLHHANGHRIPVLVRASPIRNAEGEVIGAVETFSDTTAPIMTRRSNEQLWQTVLLDPLTGIGNRRHLEIRLKAELMMFQETSNSFGVLFADIDHFKKVSDTYGHETGDKALRVVANTLRHNLRATDTIGRWGGEEFVILIGDTTAQGMEAAANKLTFLVSQSRLDTEQSSLRMTISIGATLVTKEDTMETLIHRADQLMYQSKNAGRNRVTIG
jgi:diguanylate cyclase (GGDEF)-like protein/PAS domain S-box-containing protein